MDTDGFSFEPSQPLPLTTRVLFHTLGSIVALEPGTMGGEVRSFDNPPNLSLE